MGTSWVQIAQTTIPEYSKVVEEAAMRKSVLPAMTKNAGRWSYNHSGTEINWVNKKKRVGLSPYEDLQTIFFQRVARHQRVTLDWRSYVITDLYSELDELKNRGAQAQVDAFSNFAEQLLEDANEDFLTKFYIDGNATGYTSEWHGLHSCLGHTTAPSGNAKLRTPNSTYAGLSTTPGTYGGSWDVNGSSQSIWPDGRGDILYEFWSPLVIDYYANAFGNGATGWRANCLSAMRYALTCKARNAGDKKNCFFLLDRDLHREFKDEQQLKEKIVASKDSASSNVVKLGFDAINFDGYDVTDEYAIPRSTSSNDARQGYLIDVDAIEVLCMHDQLFKTHGPVQDDLSYKLILSAHGNFKFKSPRHHVLFVAQ